MVNNVAEEKKIYKNDEYGFEYIEYLKDNKTIRVYTKEENNKTVLKLSNFKSNNRMIKEVLKDLGMGENFIDKTNEEKLSDYALADSIVGISSYIKINEDGLKTVVSEEEAIENSKKINNSRAVIITPVPGFPEEPEEERYVERYDDEYMHMYLLIVHLEGERYSFSLDIDWLTSPFFRFEDSIGICAEEITVINSTKSGYFSYGCMTINTITGATTNTFSDSIDLEFQSVTNSRWAGAAGSFNLPLDIAYDNYSVQYFNMIAHCEFEANIAHPTLATYFNVIGTYDHTVLSLPFDATISFGYNNISAGIGFSPMIGVERRSIETGEPIYYVPNN